MGVNPITDSDRAGIDFWDDYWGGVDSIGTFDPNIPDLDNHMAQVTHLFLVSILEALPVSASKLLFEAGCGGSRWLPYFAQQFGLRVAGMDYSELGCKIAQHNLDINGVQGQVKQANLFDPPQDMLENADIVFSAGLAEHFSPTSDLVQRLTALARPGGLVLTLVPNMCGLPGLLQRILNKKIYQTHVPLSPKTLAQAHEEAGLEVHSAGHLGTINLSVVNLGPHRQQAWYGAATRMLAWAGKWYWILERAGLPSLPNPLTSPIVFCVANKPRKT